MHEQCQDNVDDVMALDTCIYGFLRSMPSRTQLHASGTCSDWNIAQKNGCVGIKAASMSKVGH